MAFLVQVNQDNLAVGEGVYDNGDQVRISDEQHDQLVADGAFDGDLLTDLGAVPDDEGDEVYVQGTAVPAPAALTSTVAVGATPTKAEFDALRADVVSLRGTVAALLTALSGTGKPLE